jgi:hypothetical protein
MQLEARLSFRLLDLITYLFGAPGNNLHMSGRGKGHESTLTSLGALS